MNARILNRLMPAVLAVALLVTGTATIAVACGSYFSAADIKKATETLAKTDAPVEERRWAAQMISMVFDVDDLRQETIDALFRAAESDEDNQVRANALNSLGRQFQMIDGNQFAGFTISRDKLAALVAAAIKSDDANNRRTGLSLDLMLAGDDNAAQDSAVARLVAAADDADAEVRMFVAWTLRKFDATERSGDAVVKALIRLLGDDDENVRRAAIGVIASWGHEASSAAPLLEAEKSRLTDAADASHWDLTRVDEALSAIQPPVETRRDSE